MKALILFLSSAVAGYSTAYTASVTGDWSNPATFGGAGTPGAGDTITINDGIVLSCTDARTIGTDPGNDSSTAAIQTNGTSGTGVLVVQTGCHLTVQGSVLMGDSAWYITPGTWVTHHASSGTGYSWKVGQIANKHARLYVGKTYPGGVTNSLLRVTMDNDNTSIPAIGFAPATNPADAGNVESYYADWSYWGIVGKWFIRQVPLTNNLHTYMEGNTFDHCGAIALPASTASSNISFQNNVVTNAVLTTADGAPFQSLLLLANNTAPTAGVTRYLKNNYIEGATYFNTGNFSLSTTATAASGATSLSVASATSLAIGQLVGGAGITPLTYVTSVSGTTIGISQATYAALSATSVKFARLDAWEIEDNVFVSANPFQYFTAGVAAGGAGHTTSWRNNVIWDQSVGGNDNGVGVMCAGGNCKDTIAVISSAANVGGGPYHISPSAISVDVLIDGWVFETDVPAAGEGDSITPNGAPAIMQNLAVRNSVLTLPRDGAQPQAWWTGVGTEANYTYWSEHNVIPQSTSNNTHFGFGHGWELSSGHAGIFWRIASNLMWGIGTVGPAGIVRPNPAAVASYPPADGSFNGADYNGWYNFPSGPYDTSGVTYGFTNAKYTNPSPPGTNDVNADPRFRDLTRHVFTWPMAALGYTATDGLWANLPAGTVAAGTLVTNPKSSMYGNDARILYRSKRAHDKATIQAEPGGSQFRGAYSAGATYVAGDMILDSTATSNTTSHICILSGAAPGTLLSNTTYFAVDPTGTMGWRYYWEPYALYLLRTWLPAGTKIGNMSPIEHAIKWIREGYTSTNLSYSRKGHDAADIGLPIRVYNAPGITGGGVY